jgi:hypothetical protein
MNVPVSSSVISYRGDLLDHDARLAECSDCHAAVPWDSFQAHIRWHSRILYASPAAQAAAERERVREASER